MSELEPKSTRRRRPRGSIAAADIVTGAFEVARRVSLDQLSMPGLAEHLDVGVTSIYWYFRKKEDLLSTMTEVAVNDYLAAAPQMSEDATWREVLVEHCTHMRAAYRDDHILCDLLLMRPSTYSREATQRVFEPTEAILVKLIAAGFSPEDALHTFNTASVYTRGMIIHDRILRLGDAPTLDARQRRMTDWSTMPVLRSLVDEHPLAGTTDEDFEFSLGRLIAGFEALLAGSQRDVKRTNSRMRSVPVDRSVPLDKVPASKTGQSPRRAALAKAPAKRGSDGEAAAKPGPRSKPRIVAR